MTPDNDYPLAPGFYLGCKKPYKLVSSPASSFARHPDDYLTCLCGLDRKDHKRYEKLSTGVITYKCRKKLKPDQEFKEYVYREFVAQTPNGPVD